MSLLPYALARPLFSLDAESAHELTMHALERTQGTLLQGLGRHPGGRPGEVAGLRFPNRIGLAAGLDKNARCIDALGAMGFGFVEVGTVTPKGQPGNPKPRMFRLPQANALINRLGFNNEGLEAFIANVKRPASAKPAAGHAAGPEHRQERRHPIEQATSDYLTCLDGVYPHADYVTVNISSPNTKNLRALQSDEALDALLGALAARRAELQAQQAAACPVREDRARPGRGPDRGDCRHAAAPRHGRRDRHQHHAQPRGGQGPAACRGSRRPERRAGARGQQPRDPPPARQPGPDYPIIGVGGVMSGADAASKIEAGASLVQIYTGLIYRGPALVGEAARARSRPRPGAAAQPAEPRRRKRRSARRERPRTGARSAA
jgi:dihydroorotate dehydrogenase